MTLFFLRARLATAAIVAAATLPCLAEAQRSDSLSVARIFGSGAVIQRDARVPVWGRAPAGAEVTVTFRNATARATTSADGSWRVELPAGRAGGPFTLEVSARGQRLTMADVLVGDVWVASGQSNMEWPLRLANDGAREAAAAADAQLRHFKVPVGYAWQPESEIAGGDWVKADPAHAGDFSAVGYFFARRLRESTGVPIAILNVTWGGSSVEPWIPRAELGIGDSAWSARREAERVYQEERRVALSSKLGSLPTVDSGWVDGRAAWADPAFDDDAWARIRVPSPWESQGYAGLDGVVWYRTSFELTAEETRQPVTLSLATIDDVDVTWVNGVEVGRTGSYDLARRYSVPAAALRPGRNVVAIRVTDGGGGGGIIGLADRVHVDIGGTRRSLAGEWAFKVGIALLREDGQHVNKIPTALFNRMVHPLLEFPIRGVIWYQGESNANNDEQAVAYRAPFQTLIRSWRSSWRSGAADGAFPFLWVQLPNFGAVDTVPPSRAAWALIRESQAAALSLPRTGQAVTIEVGDAADLHPKNKKDVGERLALTARRVAYGENVIASGPVYRRHRVRGSRVEIEFDAHGALVTRDSSGAVGGFAIAAADGRFVWANARIVGDRVEVWSDSVPNPVAVRYAWGNSPRNLGLFNRAGLPAAPFRTDAW